MAASVRREVVVPLSPSQLWPALTEPAHLAEWFAPEVEIDLRPGGAAVFRWQGATRRATVDAVEEPRRFAFRWAQPDGDGESVEVSRVEFTLDPVEEGTRLRVVESAETVTSMPAVAACLAAAGGWEVLFRRLAGSVSIVTW